MVSGHAGRKTAGNEASKNLEGLVPRKTIRGIGGWRSDAGMEPYQKTDDDQLFIATAAVNYGREAAEQAAELVKSNYKRARDTDDDKSHSDKKPTTCFPEKAQSLPFISGVPGMSPWGYYGTPVHCPLAVTSTLYFKKN